MTPEEIQKEHYRRTAASYDADLGTTPEHEFALYLLLSFIDSMEANSMLDVGTGTGRGLRFVMDRRPNMTLRGVEPVQELRDEARRNGVPPDWIIEGDGYRLPYPDGAFDLVTEFGVLHHVKQPELLVREMIRVARYGVVLSDTNNLGQGGFAGRMLKNVAYGLGCWKLFNLLRTRGRGYVVEPNDGLWYYYTVLSHFRELKQSCHSVHVINTRRTSMHPMFSASHIMLMATKPAITARKAFYAQLKD